MTVSRHLEGQRVSDILEKSFETHDKVRSTNSCWQVQVVACGHVEKLFNGVLER